MLTPCVYFPCSFYGIPQRPHLSTEHGAGFELILSFKTQLYEQQFNFEK